MAAICLATGGAIRVLRRLPRFVFLATLAGAAGMLFVFASTPDQSFNLVGRTLALDATTRAFLLPAIGITAALALLSPLTFLRAGDLPASVIANSLGAFLFWSLAPFILAIALDSFPLAVAFWALGLLVLIFLAQTRRIDRVGGAAHFLFLTILATASLWLANRLLELYPLTPENLDLLRGAVFFLIFGSGVLLAVVPLNLWLGTFADEMPLLGIAFLLGVGQSVGFWLIAQLLTRTPWLVEKSPVLNAFFVIGVLSVIGGAVIALAERRDHRFLAALALLSLGDVLIGLGLGSRVTFAGAGMALLNRAFGIALLSGGLCFVRYHPERRWQTIGISAILAGGGALCALPLTLGAVARAAIYREIPDPNIVLALYAANAAGLFALMRFIAPMLKALSGFAPQIGADAQAEYKIIPVWGTVIVMILFGAIVLGGLAPQIIIEPLMAVASKMEFLR